MLGHREPHKFTSISTTIAAGTTRRQRMRAAGLRDAKIIVQVFDPTGAPSHVLRVFQSYFEDTLPDSGAAKGASWKQIGNDETYTAAFGPQYIYLDGQIFVGVEIVAGGTGSLRYDVVLEGEPVI